jgi:hypothetical protein
MQYDDLMELAQLCSLRATVRRTAAVAGTLRGMAVEYRARAYGLVASSRYLPGGAYRNFLANRYAPLSRGVFFGRAKPRAAWSSPQRHCQARIVPSA